MIFDILKEFSYNIKEQNDTSSHKQVMGKETIVSTGTYPTRISRREFLLQAGAALAGIAIATPQDSLFSPLSIPRWKEIIIQVTPREQTHSLSCEAASSGIAARCWASPPKGFNSWEKFIVQKTPSDTNPHLGFRGDIDGFPSVGQEKGSGYGVYAEPVRDVLNESGISASSVYIGPQRLSEIIKKGIPVAVWVAPPGEKPVYERDPRASVAFMKYALIRGEHCVLVNGKREKGEERHFLLTDPINASQYWKRDVDLYHWQDVFRGMSLSIGPLISPRELPKPGSRKLAW